MAWLSARGRLCGSSLAELIVPGGPRWDQREPGQDRQGGTPVRPARLRRSWPGRVVPLGGEGAIVMLAPMGEALVGAAVVGCDGEPGRGPLAGGPAAGLGSRNSEPGAGEQARRSLCCCARSSSPAPPASASSPSAACAW